MSEVMVLGANSASLGWGPAANFTAHAPEVPRPAAPRVTVRTPANPTPHTAPHASAFGTASVLAPSYWRNPPKEQNAKQGSAWLTAEDVAKLLLQGEFLEASVTVPSRFAPQAVASAESSVRRWTEEGRIFAIHDLYPRYQFDEFGRPFAIVERALKVFGKEDPLRVGNWFSTRNGHLEGHRPQELIESKPAEVLRALTFVQPARPTTEV